MSRARPILTTGYETAGQGDKLRGFSHSKPVSPEAGLVKNSRYRFFGNRVYAAFAPYLMRLTQQFGWTLRAQQNLWRP